METAKKSWPTVPGTMLDCAIVRTSKAYLERPAVNRSVNDDSYYRTVNVWAIQSQVQYQVGGETYTGTEATATAHVDPISDFPNGPSPQMKAWAGQLAKGSPVVVHYDPNQPAESYGIYTESPALNTTLTSGFVLLALALGLIAAPRVFHS